MEVIELLLNSNKNYNDILRLIAEKYHGPQKKYSQKLWAMDYNQCQEEYLRIGKILSAHTSENCRYQNIRMNGDEELKRLQNYHRRDILLNNGQGCQKEIHDRVRVIEAPFKARYQEFKKSVEAELGYSHEDCREMRIIKGEELREAGSKKQFRKNNIKKEIKSLEKEIKDAESNIKNSQYIIDETNRMIKNEKFGKEEIKTLKKQIKEQEKKVKNYEKIIKKNPEKIEKKTIMMNKIIIKKKN